MLNSILEQKMALAAYGTENSIPILTTHQLDLASKVVQVLAPIEEITQMIFAEAACISMIIPLVRGLMKTLEKHNQDSGVHTMKAEMLASLKQRFADIEKEEHLVLATILDPRYKNKFINNQDAATEILKEKYRAQVSAASDKTEQPPSQQEISTNQEKQSDLWESVTEMLEESGVNFIGEVNEPLIDVRKGNPYKWWHNNMSQYPILAHLARKYLSAPPTSVTSERLFSTAGEIYEERRNRLSPDHADTLLFIKHNIELFGGQYKF